MSLVYSTTVEAGTKDKHLLSEIFVRLAEQIHME